MVALMVLVHRVKVRILVRLPIYGGSSLIGKASICGIEEYEFESRLSPQTFLNQQLTASRAAGHALGRCTTVTYKNIFNFSFFSSFFFTFFSPVSISN